MPRVVHFEIHADEPQRCAVFYEKLFGWAHEKFGDMPYWIVTTGTPNEPGIDGAILPRVGGSGDRVNGFVCTVDVPDIDTFIARAQELGAEQAMPKNAVPGVGWTAYFKDTEGNIFGMFQTAGPG
jgi:predicted enzyme related to lactoylglutathione lyase